MDTLLLQTCRKHVFFFGLSVILAVLPAFDMFVIETKISNENNFTVTACGKTTAYKIAVFEKRLNWFQAQKFCNDAGFLALDAARPHTYHKIGVYVFLERTLDNFTSEIFWQNQFRSDNAGLIWYNYVKNHCAELISQEHFELLPQQDELCSIAVINSTEEAFRDRIKFFPENCMAEHPFMCFVKTGPQVFQSYDGYYVDGSLSLTSGRTDVGLQGFTECVRICDKITNCLAVVYNHENGSCTTHLPNPWYLHAYPNVTYVGWNITFAHKAGCNLSYIRLEETPAITVTENYTFPLPNCSEPMATLPDGYCPCDNQNYTTEDLNQMVSELVQNLTVQRDTTSAYKRTKTSADDTRIFARAVGGIGIIVTVAFFLATIISDVWAWNIGRLHRLERLRYRMERKKNTTTSWPSDDS